MLRHLYKRFLALPNSMGLMVWLHLFMPFIAIFILPSPFLTLKDSGLGLASLDVMVFSVCPLLFVYFVLSRNIYAIYTYAINCILLLFYIFQYVDLNGILWNSFQLLLTIVVFLGGSIILGNDQLLPLIFRGERLWRKSPRLRTERLIQVFLPNGSKDTVLLKNCSNSGLSIAILSKDVMKFFEEKSLQSEIRMRLQLNGKIVVFEGNLVWNTVVEDQLLLGFKGKNLEQTQEILDIVYNHTSSHGFYDAILKFLLRGYVKKILLLIWSILFSMSVALPSCGRVESKSMEFNSTQNSEVVSLPVSFTGLNLTNNILSPEIRIHQCLSGFDQIVTTSIQEFKIYQYDQNCVVSLNKFSIDGEVYIMEAGQTFDPSQGAVNSFVGNLGGKTKIVVVSQLPTVPSPGDQVQFDFLNHQVQGSDLVYNVNKNIVTVNAEKLTYLEGTDTTITYTFFKIAEENTNPLVINYSVEGTTIDGTDINFPSGSITIPGGQKTVSLDITILDDSNVEPIDLLKISISDSTEYFHYGVGAVIIEDDDSVLPEDQLVFRLEPGSILNQAGNVFQWDDLSAQQHMAYQSVANKQPQLITTGVGGRSSVAFDGSSSSLYVDDSTTLNLTPLTQEKTISLVFNTGADVVSRQFLWDAGDHLRGMNLYIESGQLYFGSWNQVDDDGGILTPWQPQFTNMSIEANQDYLITLEFNGTNNNLKIYQSGIEAASVNGIGPLYSHPETIGIGAVKGKSITVDGGIESNGASNFEGQLSEFIVYNKILTSEEFVGMQEVLKRKYSFIKPLLDISSSSQAVSEGNSGGSVITITRDYISALPLEVNLLVSGTFVNGVDTENIPLSLIIPAFEQNVQFAITAIDDVEFEQTEQIIIQIADNANYELLNGVTNIDLLDNETPQIPSSNLVWLDASQMNGLIHGSTVSTWDDLSDFSLQLTQANIGNQPVYEDLGSNIAISFDGVDDFLELDTTAEIGSAGPYVEKSFLFSLMTGTDVTTQQFIYKQGGKQRGISFEVFSGRIYFNNWNKRNDDRNATTPWGVSSISAPILPNTRYIIHAEFNYNTQQLHLSLNGSKTSLNTTLGYLFGDSGTIEIGGVNSQTLDNLGNTINGGSFFGGRIFEMFLFNQVLNPSEVQEMEAYLTAKYLQ